MLKRRRMKDKKEMVEDGYRLCRICGEPIIKLGGNRKELNNDEFHWACVLWAKVRNIRKENRKTQRRGMEDKNGNKKQKPEATDTRSLRKNETMGEKTGWRWDRVT